MNKFFIFITATFLSLNLSSQTKKQSTSNNSFFDEKLAIKQAKAKGMADSEVQGYVNALHYEYQAQKNFQSEKHDHNNDILDMGTVYVNANNQKTYIPNNTQSTYCPNAGFEQLNFNNWLGSYGTVSTGPIPTGPSTYSQMSATIANSAGLNASLINAQNYHTIMTTPSTNNVYPNSIGYDSIAVKAVGSQSICEIPVVNPFGGPASTRLNGAIANYRASKITYNMALNPNNKALKIAFAIVLNSSSSAPHNPNEQPYFSVQVRDQNGILIPACSQYTLSANPGVVDTLSPYYDPNWSLSALNSSFDAVYYRKWSNYILDLSNSPGVTSVNIEFYVAGCAQGGHFGYAYVDAECGSSSIISEMCSGSTSANLIAPSFFTGYQWFDSSNNPISGATNDTLQVSSSNIGNVFSVQLTSPSGCTSTQSITVANSVLTINDISSTSTCSGGNSGSATINTIGSSAVNSYTWTSISTGSVVSNSQMATNLTPGNYSVVVNSGTCGQVSGSVTVAIAAPLYSYQYKTFCGNNTFIVANPGINYQWYMGTTLISGAAGTNDTLLINSPANNSFYTVVYTTPGNCRDSVTYILNQTFGSYVSLSNIANVCPGNSNGSVVLNLAPINPAPYTYTVKDISGNTIFSATTSSTTHSVVNLAAGSYTSIVSDGNCIYANTFTINSIQTNFTMTPGYSNSCSALDTARINFSFGNVSPVNCGLSSGTCSSPNTIQLGTSSNVNTQYAFPSVYGHYYRNSRHQILFTAAELLAAGVLPGKISSVSFMVNSIPVGYIGTLPGLKISLKCVTQTSIASAFDNAGLVQVYNATNYTPVVGWNQHLFTTAYEWDGTSDLLADICYSLNPSAPYTNNPVMPSSTTPVARCIYQPDDVNSLCGGVANFPTTTTERPNIKFDNCGSSSPSSYTISVSSNGAMVQNYNNDSIKVVPSSTPTAVIVYTITVTNPTGGCTASQTFTMSSNLAAVTTVTNASCGSCPNGSVQVIVSCGTGPYSYVWSPGGATTQSVSGLAPGCYTVTVTDAALNSVTAQACVTFSTKLDEASVASGLSIYPNPSNSVFNILSETVLDKLDITVINPLGQTIVQESLKNTKQATIDLSKLSKGIYYLKTNTDSGSKLFKLILE